MKHIFKVTEMGDIEYEDRAGPIFYTLPGIKFGKSMTVDHTEGSAYSSSAQAVGYTYLSPKQKTFLQCLRDIPMDKPAILV